MDIDVPFRDLPRLHSIDRGPSRAAVAAALDSCDFGRPNGLIARFEADWARYCGVRHAIATSSGSAALLLTYLGLGLGPGDEIVTVPNTFVATAEAAWLLGARVRLVDVDPVTQAMDQDQAVAALTPRTRAVVVLHPFGRIADLDRIRCITAEQGIALVEEACHAHGAVRDGRVAGSLGDCAVFSFGPTKPLAGLGEGGAVVTDDDELAERLRRWNNHGRDGGAHVALGLNFRIHPIEAAYLTRRLALLPELLNARRRVAAAYNDVFVPFGVAGNPGVAEPGEHSYYVYVLDVPQRDQFRRRLAETGIGTDVHYPVPIHHQPAHREKFRDTAFPVCDQLQGGIVSLPMMDGLRPAEVEHVRDQVTRVLKDLVS
jgi:dTDP-4-amino-4,6-dideoxygalactose transaminase